MKKFQIFGLSLFISLLVVSNTFNSCGKSEESGKKLEKKSCCLSGRLSDIDQTLKCLKEKFCDNKPCCYNQGFITRPLPESGTDVKLFWQSVGCGGPTLLFVHGVGESTEVWCPQLEELGKHFHCVAVDLRGHGKSSAPDTGTPYTYQDFFEDIYYMVNELGIRHPVYIGHSLGTTIGIRYCSVLPQSDSASAQKFIALDGGPTYALTEDWPWTPTPLVNFEDPLQSLLALAGGLRLGLGYGNLVLEDPSSVFPEIVYCPTQIEENILPKYSEILNGANQDVLANIVEFLLPLNLFDELQNITAPTLLGFGQFDFLVSQESYIPGIPGSGRAMMREAIPNSILVEFANKGHVCSLTDIGEVNATIKNFVCCDLCCDTVNLARCNECLPLINY